MAILYLDVPTHIEKQVDDIWGRFIYDSETVDSVRAYLTARYPEGDWIVYDDEYNEFHIDLTFKSESDKIMFILKHC